MSLIGWIILLAVVGLVLIIAEAMLPTHGALGVLGVVALVCAIVLCFLVNFWLGFGAAIGGMISVPLLGLWLISAWPRTAVGRRVILPPVPANIQPVAVQVGQVGVTVSALRPVGQCDFDGIRLEAMSEFGIIEAGRRVKVVGLSMRRPVVRVED